METTLDDTSTIEKMKAGGKLYETPPLDFVG